MNPTFTSKGGFRIIINGITIYEVIAKKISSESGFIAGSKKDSKSTTSLEISMFCISLISIWINWIIVCGSSDTLIVVQKYGPLESKWDTTKKLTEMLRQFQGFANKVPTSFLTYLWFRDIFDIMMKLSDFGWLLPSCVMCFISNIARIAKLPCPISIYSPNWLHCSNFQNGQFCQNHMFFSVVYVCLFIRQDVYRFNWYVYVTANMDNQLV